ncbi:MAG: hypothetical protein JSU89_03715 [Myxococcales bacterium]|nr:MAG: hypothetical protein JSU89_03715 [Myxococcales bacterium]
MRHLLHFGLFVLALTAVTRADAQDRRHGDRHTTVVIAAGSGPRVVRPVRASYDPPRAVYDSRRTVQRPSAATHDARRAYFEQRHDLDQIVRITERWKQATANRDRHAQWKVDRRLDAWLEREIRESTREPYNHRYAQHVRMLRDELAILERRTHHSHGYHSRGYQGRRHQERGYHGRGHHERGHGAYYAKKARILDELVELSERQVYRAEARLRHPHWPSFAYR